MARSTRSTTTAAAAAAASTGPSSGKGKRASSSRKASTGKKKASNSETDHNGNANYDATKDPALFEQFLRSLNKKTPSSAEKKRAREEEESLIRQKTSQMLQEEESEDEDEDEDLPPAPKKRKNAQLSDDEERLAAALDDPLPRDNGDDVGNPNQSEDDFGTGEHDGNDNEDEDDGAGEFEEQEELGPSSQSTVFANNGINVVASRSGSRQASARYPSTSPPSTTSQSESPTASSAHRSSANGSKVKRSDLPPNLRFLADSAKSLIRTRICFGDWLLETDPERQKWIWDIIKDTPQTLGASSSEAAGQALKIISSSAQHDLRMNVITYVGYGKGALFNAIISKARSRVVGHYGLTGTQNQIAEKAEWLLEASHFIYGHLNATEKSYNADMPFGNPIIKELIQAIWFNTTRAKADIGTSRRMVKESQIPISTLLLVVAAIEHSIGEYKAGTESQLHFKEQQIRTRYKYHQKTWKGLQARSPAWTEEYPNSFYKIISKSVSMGNLADDDREENTADIENVVGANLDKVVSEGRSIFS